MPSQAEERFSPQFSSLVLRRLHTPADYSACLALQKETWGDSFAECVPPSLLMVSQKIGGVAAGAFDENGKLLGFVFGLTGVKDGRLVHWSDMLAVRPEYRDHGLGRKLKHYQQQLVREIGVGVIYWSYDPLVARNAHLNLNHLGAHVTEYVPDMYASDAVGTLYRGLSMDRFIVAWEILHEPDEAASSRRMHATRARFAVAPIANDLPSAMIPNSTLPRAAELRVEIPDDIQATKEKDLEEAKVWRATSRRAFLFYFEHGYRVEGFYRDDASGRCFYGLSASVRE
ncbi:GNAT family N-acetyltransferase [candidate division KSB1 bacterium]|nr:GNAT family N-acetyltransferase [candidate division KSB1 bacterium]